MHFENKTGAPLQAANLQDFAHRLKLNHYYQDTEANYLGGLQRWNEIIQKELGANSFRPTMAKQSLVDNSVSLPAFFENAQLGVHIPNVVLADRTIVKRPVIDRIKLLPKNTSPTVNGRDEAATKSIQINTLSNPPKWMIDGTGGLVNKTTHINQVHNNASSLINTTKKFIDIGKAYDIGHPTVINSDQIMRNIFIGYPGIKNKWTKPEIYNENQISGTSDSSIYIISGKAESELEKSSHNKGALFDANKITQAKEVYTKYVAQITQGEGVFPSWVNKEEANDGDNSKILFGPFADISVDTGNTNPHEANDINALYDSNGRTVNINLNTPMIGNFTISAQDIGAGLNDLKYQVEEVLLEILNSANAIQ